MIEITCFSDGDVEGGKKSNCAPLAERHGAAPGGSKPGKAEAPLALLTEQEACCCCVS